MAPKSSLASGPPRASPRVPMALLLFLDLGDVLTKGIAVGDKETQRFRFPSVIAHRLASKNEKMTSLQLQSRQRIPRPEDFEPDKYPRARSYPEGEAFLRDVQSVPRARFAGWQAVAHGADRQLLAEEPSFDNVDALVHKAYLLNAMSADRVRVVFLVDSGPKAEMILRYVEASPPARFSAWKPGRAEPQRVEFEVQAQALDAATCAIAALPESMSLQKVGRVLVIDIGYFRTKLYIVSAEGCEYEDQVQELGISDCVLRVLRDEQAQGLVEDEFAVLRALERSLVEIEVAGRRFNVRDTLESARRGLEEELVRVAQAAVVGHFERQGKPCKAAVIIGGGAAIVGKGLASRLTASEIGIGETWVTPNRSFYLLEGAQRVQS